LKASQAVSPPAGYVTYTTWSGQNMRNGIKSGRPAAGQWVAMYVKSGESAGWCKGKITTLAGHSDWLASGGEAVRTYTGSAQIASGMTFSDVEFGMIRNSDGQSWDTKKNVVRFYTASDSQSESSDETEQTTESGPSPKRARPDPNQPGSDPKRTKAPAPSPITVPVGSAAVASVAAAQIPKPAFRQQGPGEGGRNPLNCYTTADIDALSNQRGTWEDTKRLLAKSGVFPTEYLNSITNQTEARKLGALWIQTNKQAFQMGARPGPYMTTPTTSPDAQSNGILDVFWGVWDTSILCA
jgi:hypothetical protein